MSSTKSDNSLEYSLGSVLLNEVEAGNLTFDDARLVAVDLLEKIEQINEKHELIPILEDLTAKWPFFQKILDTEKLKKDEPVNTDEKIDSIRQQLAKFI